MKRNFDNIGSHSQLDSAMGEPMNKYKTALDQIKNAIVEAEEIKSNGEELLKKHCEFIREDIENTVESKIDEMRKLGQTIRER